MQDRLDPAEADRCNLCCNAARFARSRREWTLGLTIPEKLSSTTSLERLTSKPQNRPSQFAVLIHLRDINQRDLNSFRHLLTAYAPRRGDARAPNAAILHSRANAATGRQHSLRVLSSEAIPTTDPLLGSRHASSATIPGF